MIIGVCRDCEYHVIKWDQEEKKSHCSKENMWSIYTKCITNIALAQFIERERLKNQEEGLGK
jgi:hypothetical protein